MCRAHFLSLKIIAYAPLRVDILRIARVLLDLLAQSPDMDIHRPDVARILVSPDNVEQVLSAVNLIRIEDKQLKDIELLRREIDLLSVDLDAPALAVHLESVDLHGLRALLLRLRSG